MHLYSPRDPRTPSYAFEPATAIRTCPEGVGGNHMIAKALAEGIELAPEGYVQNGTVRVHGVAIMRALQPIFDESES
jgi:hypothetical protein